VTVHLIRRALPLPISRTGFWTRAGVSHEAFPQAATVADMPQAARSDASPRFRAITTVVATTGSQADRPGSASDKSQLTPIDLPVVIEGTAGESGEGY